MMSFMTCCVFQPSTALSFFPEEALHQFGAFVGHYATCDLRPRVQSLWSEASETTLFIGCSIDDSADLRPAEGAGAHHARLHSDVKRAVIQVLSAKMLRRRCDSLHLSMRGHIVQQFSQVVTLGDNPVPAHHDSPIGISPCRYASLASASACFM